MQKVSKARLEALLIEELRKAEPEASNTSTIGIYDVVERGHPNWSIGVCNFGGGDADLCARALTGIVRHFQGIYEIG